MERHIKILTELLIWYHNGNTGIKMPWETTNIKYKKWKIDFFIYDYLKENGNTPDYIICTIDKQLE